VDVEIGLSAQDSRDQRRLSLRKLRRRIRPDLEVNESLIVERKQGEIKDWGGIGPRGPSQREPEKGRHPGGDPGVHADWCAAMDVRRRIGRGQAAKRCVDLQCLGRRIQEYRCEAKPRWRA